LRQDLVALKTTLPRHPGQIKVRESTKSVVLGKDFAFDGLNHRVDELNVHFLNAV